MLPRPESRRYRVLGLLGTGGFGKVYRARLEGAEGFLKDVAVKLLHEDVDNTGQIIERFRDESRILGLVRDRAVVNVDPPTRLGGRWAVVMEYVEGHSMRALLRRHGPLPPRVALAVVAEVARALDAVYRQEGPDGQPLRLLHRDLKPSNLQLTRSGQVKILDFGIARADFGNREATTTGSIGGTYGYIAPERLHGEEIPAGDIYSLGVVLRVLLTARPPRRKPRVPPRPPVHDPLAPGFDEAMALSEAMTQESPEDRPAAREVEEYSLSLVDRLDGPRLRQWADQKVQLDESLPDDDLVGDVLNETLAVLPMVETTSELAPTTTTSRQVAAVGLAGAMGVVGGMLLISGLIAGIWWTTTNTEPEASGPQTALPAGIDTRSEAAPQPASPPPAPALEHPAPTPAQATPAAGVAPVANAGSDTTAPEEPEPAPLPVVDPPQGEADADATEAAPEAAPAPSPPPAETVSLIFSSVPLGAEVFLDGRSIGKTPIINHAATIGPHEVRMERGGQAIERDIMVGPRAPVRHIWQGEDEWSAQF